MKDDLREVVAKALATAADRTPWDAMHLTKRAYWLNQADAILPIIARERAAAIAAARPVIGEECAKVAEAARIEWEKAMVIINGENVVLQSHIAAAETIAAAIRSATRG